MVGTLLTRSCLKQLLSHSGTREIVEAVSNYPWAKKESFKGLSVLLSPVAGLTGIRCPEFHRIREFGRLSSDSNKAVQATSGTMSDVVQTLVVAIGVASSKLSHPAVRCNVPIYFR
jgi:hypothetical protein